MKLYIAFEIDKDIFNSISELWEKAIEISVGDAFSPQDINSCMIVSRIEFKKAHLKRIPLSMSYQLYESSYKIGRERLSNLMYGISPY